MTAWLKKKTVSSSFALKVCLTDRSIREKQTNKTFLQIISSIGVFQGYGYWSHSYTQFSLHVLAPWTVYVTALLSMRGERYIRGTIF